MKRKLLFLALTLAVCFTLLPSTALAVENDTNSDGYHDGDVAVINALIENNGLHGVYGDLYTLDDPDSWEKIGWNEESPKRITSISFDYQRVSGDVDLSALTELTDLDCGSSEITSLDVSGCVSLVTLKCNATQLTELDVSGCTSLQTLTCGSSMLESLDVSNHPTLETLDCKSAYSIESINASGCENLTTLTAIWCSSLSELNVDGCTALETLSCYDGALISLDVTGCEALTTLECGDSGSLTEVNASGCANLTTLDCHSSNVLVTLNVDGCEKLQTLKCYNTKVTTLDVSECAALVTLKCYGTNITALDVSGLANLQELSCSDCSLLTTLTLTGCTGLGELYCDDTAIRALNASGCTNLNTLDASGCTSLGTLNVGGCALLTTLNASRCTNLATLTVSGCAALATLDCSFCALTALDVTDCAALTTLDCGYNEPLATLTLDGCTGLTTLKCHETGITALDVSDCTDLTKLECNNTNITTLNVSDFAKLQELSCNDCSALTALTVTGCSKLNTLRCDNTNIVSLDLSNLNQLETLSCNENTSMTSLNVSGCTTLPSLDCAGNTSLATLTVNGCTGLTTLKCYNTAVASLDVSTCVSLTTLECHSNASLATLTVTGCPALATLKCYDTGITALDVSGCSGLKALQSNNTPLLTMTVPAYYEVGESASSQTALRYALPTPAREGYTFIGWYTAPVDGEEVTVGSTFDAATTIYSQWKVIVSFDGNGGSGSMDDVLVFAEAEYTLPESAFTAPEGYQFDTWAAGSVEGTQVDAGDSYVITSDTTFYALWELIPYDVTVSDTVGGTIDSSHETATVGTTVTITVTAGERYELVSVSVEAENGVEVTLAGGENGEYTFTMPASNVTVSADFAYQYEVTAAEAENGTVGVDEVYVIEGNTVTITVTPDVYYELDSVSAVGESGEVALEDIGSGKYTFTMPASDVTVSADFAAKDSDGDGTPDKDDLFPNDPYDGNPDVDGDGIPNEMDSNPTAYNYAAATTPTANGTVNVSSVYTVAGDTVIIIVTPNKWYEIGSIRIVDANGDPVALNETDGEYSFTMPAFNVTVSVIFVAIDTDGDGTPDMNDEYIDDELNGNGDADGDGIIDKDDEHPNAPDYTVTSGETANGTVNVNTVYAVAGDTVTITVTPSANYKIGSFSVKDASGNAVTLAGGENGVYTFTMPASNVTISAVFAVVDSNDDGSTGDGNNNTGNNTGTGGGGGGGYTGPVTIPGKQPEQSRPEQPTDETPSVSFSDVPSGAYYASAVAWAVEKGITNGVGGGSFAPEASCTRGQMMTFLWRMAGCPTVSGGTKFSDVGAGSYYAEAIAWAVSMGITNGVGDGLFAPDAECTRAQMATFLFRMVGGSAAGASGFGDVDAGAWYADAVAWAVANGITNGTGGGLFSPNMNCTRGQMVTFLFRCFAE